MHSAILNSNGKKGNSGITEKPEDASTPPGKTQRGRSVQQQQSIGQLYGQMMAASIASRQSSSCASGAAKQARVLTEKKCTGTLEKSCLPTREHLAGQRKKEAEDAISRIEKMTTNIMKSNHDKTGMRYKSGLTIASEWELCNAFSKLVLTGDELTNDDTLSLCLVIVKKARKCVSDLPGFYTATTLQIARQAMTLEEPSNSEDSEKSPDSDSDVPFERYGTLPCGLARSAPSTKGNKLDARQAIALEKPSDSKDLEEPSDSENSKDSEEFLDSDSDAFLETYGTLTCVLARSGTPTEGDELESTEKFQRAVLESLERLEKNEEIWEQHDAWPLCQAITGEVLILSRKNNDVHFRRHNHAFMKIIMGPVYSIAFGKALEILQQRVDANCSWECWKSCIGIYCPDMIECCPENNYKEMYFEIIQQALTNELRYLSSLKDFPLEFAVNHVMSIISNLSRHVEIYDCPRMDETRKHIYAISMSAVDLRKEIGKRMEEWSDSNKKESFDKLEREVLRGTTDENAKRQYSDLLSWRLTQIVQASGGICLDAQKSGHLLEKLADFHDRYARHIDTSYVLRQDLQIVISGVARQVLLAIMDGDINESEMALILIGKLDRAGYLDKKCQELYIDCTNPGIAMGTTAKTDKPDKPDKTTDAQCRQQIAKIFSCMKNCHSESSYLVVAEQLKQLLDEHGKTINLLDDTNELKSQIEDIVQQDLCNNLFNHIIDEFNNYQLKVIESPHMCIDNKMGRHKPVFIQLRPYMFLFGHLFHSSMDSKKIIGYKCEPWQKAACAVWHDDIVRMSEATEFSEDDIKQLLYLKEIAPTVPDLIVRPLLQSVLANLLQFAERQENGASVSPAAGAERITALRNWAHDLESDQSASALRDQSLKGTSD